MAVARAAWTFEELELFFEPPEEAALQQKCMRWKAYAMAPRHRKSWCSFHWKLAQEMLTGSRPSPDYVTEEESFESSAKKPLLATWRQVGQAPAAMGCYFAGIRLSSRTGN